MRLKVHLLDDFPKKNCNSLPAIQAKEFLAYLRLDKEPYQDTLSPRTVTTLA